MAKTLLFKFILARNVLFFLQLYYEPDQGPSDDTGVNGIKVTCRGPRMDGTLTQSITQSMTWANSTWSSWSSTYPLGTAVCALKTRLQLGNGDDADVTDARFHCCDY